jgi:tetratricopeptide (TPR) repeat protein
VALLINAASLALEQGDHTEAKRMYQESLDLCCGTKDAKLAAHAMGGLAHAARVQGDHAECELRAREGASMARAVGDRLLLAANLACLGTALQALGDSAAAYGFFKETVAIERDVGNPYHLGLGLITLGRAECNAGQHDRAWEHFREGLVMVHELDHWPGTANALDGFATLAVAMGSTERAVRLWACADALRQESGAAVPHAERRRYEGEVDLAKAQLSKDAFDQAWQQGRAMTLDDAVRYAVGGNGMMAAAQRGDRV